MPAAHAARRTHERHLELAQRAQRRRLDDGGQLTGTVTRMAPQALPGLDSGGTTPRARRHHAPFPLTTATSSTAAGSNVLTFASTTGVSDGMSVTVTMYRPARRSQATPRRRSTLSAAATATISIGTTVYFGDTSWRSSAAGYGAQPTGETHAVAVGSHSTGGLTWASALATRTSSPLRRRSAEDRGRSRYRRRT